MKRFLGILFVLCMVLILIPTMAFADTATNTPDSVSVMDVPLSNGVYYTIQGGTIKSVASAPQSGYIRYDKATGVLELNNFSMTTSASTHGILVALSSPNFKSLTINLVGTNSITMNGSERGVDMGDVDCTITGSGSLTIDCAKHDALYVRSLTINDNVTLNCNTSGEGISPQVHAIEATKDVIFTNGTITATAENAEALTGSNNPYCSGIASSYGKLKISGSAKVTAKGSGTGSAIHCSRNIFQMTGGTLDASISGGDPFAVIAHGGIDVSGGKLTINSAKGGGFYTQGQDATLRGDITISGSADVTINTPGLNINIAEWCNGNLTISGGTVKLTCTGSNSIWLPNGSLTISGGNVTAEGTPTEAYPTFWTKTGINITGGTTYVKSTVGTAVYTFGNVNVGNGTLTAVSTATQEGWPALRTESGGDGGDIIISGGSVTAVSAHGHGVYTTASLAVKGGTLAAASVNGKRVSAYAKNGFHLNGNGVVYLNDISGQLVKTKGVCYLGTEVSLDNKNNTVLSGGIGTVYDNPNVTNFSKPTNSVLGTVLDNYVTATNITYPIYNGQKQSFDPKLRVEKIALTRDLVKYVDYTVSLLDGAIDAGGHRVEAVAIAGSGNEDSYESSYFILPKALTLDPSSLDVSKTMDGTTAAGTVRGRVKLKGVVSGDDVKLSYDNVNVEDFPSASPGTYQLNVVLINPIISGADAYNYDFDLLNGPFMCYGRIIDPNAPATGDSSPVALWLGLLLVGLSGIVVCGYKKRRFER